MTKLHDDLIVFDGLVVPNWFRDARDQVVPTPDERHVFELMLQGGLTAANVTCSAWENFQETMRKIVQWKRYAREFADVCRQCYTTEDIREAKKNGQVGIVLGWQNTTAIEDQIGYLELFHELGLRIVQLTYNTQNLVGSGCYEERDSGLTGFGREVVAEMNRLGIVVDLSHVGPVTADDAIAFSKQPVCYSHIAPRALKDHPRNKSDEQIRKIVDRGGFVGVTIFPPFMRNGPDSTMEDVMEIMEHMIDLTGEEGLGFGSDFHRDRTTPVRRGYWQHDKGYARQLVDMGEIKFAEGFRTYTDYGNVTAAMQKRGWSETRIRRVMGENWLRYLRDVWGA